MATQSVATIPREQRSRVRTPTVLQMEAVECGAAALGIILRHYGKYVALEELRLACGVSRDGSNALNIVNAAREMYGMKAKGVRRSSITGLLRLPRPMIVFWKFTHFLVVEGFGKDRVYLNDPATGPRSVSLEEFDESFTGIALVIEPDPARFEPSGKPFRLLDALSSRLAGSGAGVVFVLLVSLLLVVPGLVVPVFLRVFVDDVLVGGRDWLLPLLVGMGAAVVLSGALTWFQQMVLLRLETKLALSGSSRFFWHILHLPVEFFTQRYAGDIAFRVQINDRVAQLLSGELATTVINLFLIVFYAAFMLQYDVLLTVIGVALTALNLLALRLIARRRTDASRNLMQQSGKLVGTSMDGLETIETLKATGAESDFFARWAGYQANTANGEQHLGYLTQTLAVIPPLLQTLTTAAILVVGGLRVQAGYLSVGTLVALQALMLNFMRPVNQLVNLGSRLQEAEANLNRLDDVLRYHRDPLLPPETAVDTAISPGPVDVSPVETQTAAPLQRLEGFVELRDVAFSYERHGDPLIENFNLTVTPGRRVALVGRSGSGKSTVARLVAGLYQPTGGAILFDGQPRPAIPRPVLTASVALVDQSIVLFAGTVRDNLTLWDPSIPQEWVVQAARDACIHDVIAAHAMNYNQVLSAGGRNFSGGERQRLEIARALVTNPTVLVLDEATSALDPVTEKIIDDNLRRRGCTCLIVAHRLSTIRDADEILVLDHGKIVQRGTHAEMQHIEGPYADLIGADPSRWKRTELDTALDALFD